MKEPISLLLTTCLALSVSARADFDVKSGELLLRGGTLHSEAVRIDSGATLCGNGTIHAAKATLGGTTAPCGENATETGSLIFSGPVELGGVYVCKANGHTDLDLILSFNAITGTGAVQVQTQVGAVPLGQKILTGSAASDFSLIKTVADQTSLFQLTQSGLKDLLVTDLKGDTNANGIPDWWELHYFGGRTNGMSVADNDGDSSNNLNEFGAGTDPTNALSCFVVSGFEVRSVDASVIIRWSSVAGKTYTLQRATNLLTALTFTPVATHIPATPPVNVWTNTIIGSRTLFYRVVVE
jgi:hypothetical protein